MQIFLLILGSIFCTFCNGQAITNTPGKHGPETSANTARLIKNHFTNPHQEAADNVHCGLQDKAGNLWFGTTGDGVYRYDGKSFTNFTMKDGLDTNQILSILEDNSGHIWFGSRNGICRFDGKKIVKVPLPAINYNFYSSVLSNNIPSEKNAVWSIMQDKKGTIWFGTDKGVYCFDGKTFTRFLDNVNIFNKGGLTLKSVQHMLEDTKGNIWFASGPMAFEGICFYDGKSLTNFKPENQQWIRKITETKNGLILFATRQAGVCYYDPVAGQINVNKIGKVAAPPGFLNGSLTNILEDKTGNIWMASDYGNHPGDTLGGLWYSGFPANKMVENTFTKITNKAVFFMLEDKEKNIWFGTRGTGLYRYDGKLTTNFSE